MKTFSDLVFKDYAIRRFAEEGAKQAIMFFPNGYGVSVLLGDLFYSNGIDTFELAVITGDEKQYTLEYGTPITDDVLHRITAEEVTEAMKQVQQLPSLLKHSTGQI